MKKRYLLIITAIIVSISLVACQDPTVTPSGDQKLPNPASVFCEENGGTLDLRTAADGSVSGVCIFADGSECDEWAYFRSECKPGDSLEKNDAEAQESTQAPESGWLTYTDEKLGYSFEYPADCTLTNNDDPRKNVEITGPLVENENWPMLYFNHPGEDEAYRPSEDADLAKWLTDHYLSAEPRVEDVQIAGVTAVHTRHERSPQSYAFDTYFFVKNGLLYSVTILHTGDKEDWQLYDHFLNSIQFK